MKRTLAVLLGSSLLMAGVSCSKDARPVRVGAIYPLTGSQGPGGRDEFRGVSLATDLPTTKPFVKSKLLQWNDIPAISENYDVARTAIVEQVRKLLDKLSRAEEK